MGSRIRQNYHIVSALLLLAGIVLVTIAESPSFDWTRVFGATAISFGAVGLGVYVGLSNPGMLSAVASFTGSIKVQLGIAVILLLSLPVLIALIAGLVGLAYDSGGTGWVVAVGSLTLALMLAATIAAVAVGIRGAIQAGRPMATQPQPEDRAK